MKECHEKFRLMLKSPLAQAEKIIEAKDKGEVEKRFVKTMISFQVTALGLENLMDRMEIKLDSNILFSEKALKEIRGLFDVMEGQLRDARDFCSTGNPHVKQMVRHGMEEMKKLADEYALIHQDRLIMGVCMPKASYLYLDITDSLKRISKGLVEFSERV